MGIPLAFVARTGALDHARLKAQASWGQAFLPHFVQQPLTQRGSLPAGGLHQAPLTALDDMDGMDKPDFIGVPVGLYGGTIHQRTPGEVGQEQPIELLLDSLRGLRAQGARRQTQVRFELINRLFDFPALMVEADEGLDGIALGILQGGEQTDRLAQLAGARILDLILNHAGRQFLPTLMATILVDFDQKAAVM